MKERKNLAFVACQRSGHHAVLNWIAENYGDKVLHMNNCHPAGKIVPIGPNTTYENSGENKKIFVNFENKNPEQVIKFLEDKPFRPLIVLRDCYNNFASHWHYDAGLRQRDINCWVGCAKMIIQRPDLGIFYNEWFSSEDYRREISKRLNFKYGEKGLEVVPGFSGGSSFDRRRKDGQASSMDVLKRWQGCERKERKSSEPGDIRFVDIPAWRDQFTDEIVELNEQIFGMAKPF